MLILPMALALATSLQASEPRVVVRRMPAVGLEREVGISRRDPSEILHIGKLHYVFYTHSRAGDLHYPRSYSGNIWYATSEDEGHSWTERGIALERGERDHFDGYGVFDPSVVLTEDGSVLMYYTAVGPPFNFRFERAAATNAMYIGVARLRLGGDGKLMSAQRLSNEPVLGPSPRMQRRFDSLRVCDPSVMLRDGLVHLYYQGRPFPEQDDRTATGLVISESPQGPFERHHGHSAALPFSKETFVWPFREGVLSLVTQAERGLYWAVDGQHFARVLSRVEGNLNSPGLARASSGSSQGKLWGLHIARLAPDPYLERFELELVGEVPSPPATIIPAPRTAPGATSPCWLEGGNWMKQHDDILAITKRRPKDVVFLGDSITQAWGGRDREVLATGAAAFERFFGEMDTGNFGIDGDRTQHVLWRIDHGLFLRGRSKVVVLLIGTNNLPTDSPRDIAAGVHEILTRLRQVLPAGEILLLGLLPRGASAEDPARAAVNETNSRLAAFESLPRVTYMDLAGVLADAEGAPREELYAGDKLHLSARGYEVLAEVLHPVITELMLAPQLRQ